MIGLSECARARGRIPFRRSRGSSCHSAGSPSLLTSAARASLIVRAPWLPPIASSVWRAGSSPSRSIASSRGGSERSEARTGIPVCTYLSAKRGSALGKRSPHFVDQRRKQTIGQPRDARSVRAARSRRDTHRKNAAPAPRARRESRRNRRSRSTISGRSPPQDAHALQRAGSVVETDRTDSRMTSERSEGRRVSGRLATVCNAITGSGNDRRFEPIGRTDERRSSRRVRAARRQSRSPDTDGRRCRRRQRRRSRGHGAAATRRWRPTLAISATATRLTISELPPNEMNGSGTPVTGHDDVTTPMLTKA